METTRHENDRKSQSGSIFGKRVPSSHKSNNSGGKGGPGSVITSLSDLERIEKIMTTAQFASKAIVKYFSKHLDEFRREQNTAKDIILSEHPSIPESMNKHIPEQFMIQK